MIYISIIILVVSFCLLCLQLGLYHKNKHFSNNAYEQLSKQQKEKLKKEYDNQIAQLDEGLEKIKLREQKELEQLYREKNIQIEALNFTKELAETERQSREQAIRDAKKLVDQQIEDYRINKLKLTENEIAQQKLNMENKFNSVLLEYTNLQNKKKEEIDKEILEIQTQLNEYKAKRDAINEQIRKEEELANTVETHSIHLAAAAQDDIKYLMSIEPNIHNKEILRKLIWTTYLQPEFNAMIKRQFGSANPKNVIYCIEHIDTHKKYIGKTQAEVTKRWTEHFKASLNIGTISHQAIHDALCGHWSEFMFYIIEETTKENLNDREKYYINFYETDKYGFNLKKGG